MSRVASITVDIITGNIPSISANGEAKATWEIDTTVPIGEAWEVLSFGVDPATNLLATSIAEGVTNERLTEFYTNTTVNDAPYHMGFKFPSDVTFKLSEGEKLDFILKAGSGAVSAKSNAIWVKVKRYRVGSGVNPKTFNMLSGGLKSNKVFHIEHASISSTTPNQYTTVIEQEVKKNEMYIYDKVGFYTEDAHSYKSKIDIDNQFEYDTYITTASLNQIPYGFVSANGILKYTSTSDAPFTIPQKLEKPIVITKGNVLRFKHLDDGTAVSSAVYAKFEGVKILL